MQVQIYHHSRCSKSRETLKLLESKGIEPEVILYLQQPLEVEQVETLFRQLGFQDVREMMRRKEPLYKELAIDRSEYQHEDRIRLLSQYPQLLERPIVVYGDHAKIGRPPEAVLDLFAS